MYLLLCQIIESSPSHVEEYCLCISNIIHLADLGSNGMFQVSFGAWQQVKNLKELLKTLSSRCHYRCHL